jgi:hypothetical protein
MAFMLMPRVLVLMAVSDIPRFRCRGVEGAVDGVEVAVDGVEQKVGEEKSVAEEPNMPKRDH